MGVGAMSQGIHDRSSTPLVSELLRSIRELPDGLTVSCLVAAACVYEQGGL